MRGSVLLSLLQQMDQPPGMSQHPSPLTGSALGRDDKKHFHGFIGPPVIIGRDVGQASEHKESLPNLSPRDTVDPVKDITKETLLLTHPLDHHSYNRAPRPWRANAAAKCKCSQKANKEGPVSDRCAQIVQW